MLKVRKAYKGLKEKTEQKKKNRNLDVLASSPIPGGQNWALQQQQQEQQHDFLLRRSTAMISGNAFCTAQ